MPKNIEGIPNSRSQGNGTGGAAEFQLDVEQYITNLRSALTAADTGSGAAKKGAGDGKLDRQELMGLLGSSQGGRFSMLQLDAFEKMGPDAKVKIDKIIEPFAKAIRGLDANHDGLVTPAELASAKSLEGKDSHVR